MNPRTRTPLVLSVALLAALGVTACQQETDDTLEGSPPVADTAPADPAAPPGTMPGETTGDMGDTMGDDAMGDDMMGDDDTAAGPTALDVTSIALGTEAGPDDTIPTPQDTFAADDNVVVAVDTDGAASDAELQVRLVSADGKTVTEQSETVTTTGADTTVVTLDPAEALAAGSYTVEVWVDGSKANSTELTVE